MSETNVSVHPVVLRLMEASGIEKAECLNCQNCHPFSDGDYGEHRWYECSKVDRFQYLKSFPFKKTKDCWVPSFWCSKFAGDFDPEEGTQYEDRVRAFHKAVEPILEENENCDAAPKGSESTDCSADLSDEQIRLAEALGSFLWESSTLRHGLFTPPEFSRLVSERIKQYFYEQNDQSEARDQ